MPAFTASLLKEVNACGEERDGVGRDDKGRDIVSRCEGRDGVSQRKMRVLSIKGERGGI